MPARDRYSNQSQTSSTSYDHSSLDLCALKNCVGFGSRGTDLDSFMNADRTFEMDQVVSSMYLSSITYEPKSCSQFTLIVEGP